MVIRWPTLWPLAVAGAFSCLLASACLAKTPPELRAPTDKTGAPASTAEQPPAIPAPRLDPKKPSSADRAPLETPVQSLFRELVDTPNTDAVAQSLAREVRAQGGACKRVTDFQISGSSTGVRQLKVKCPDVPLYLVVIDTAGRLKVGGGDGRVPDMLAGDGKIYSFYGIRADDYFAQERKASAGNRYPVQLPAKAAIGADADPAEARARARTLMLWLIVANLALIALFVIFLRAYLRRGRRDLSGWRSLTSEEKDYLIEESAEILPNLFAHPSGMYIVRGARGRRRIFTAKLPAYIYLQSGFRFGDIK